MILADVRLSDFDSQCHDSGVARVMLRLSHGRRFGQFGDVLVVGFAFLPLHNFRDVLPGFAQAVGAPGHLVCDHAVEFAQSVAGYRSEHMVFGVVVHVPVEKLDEGIEVDCTAAKAKIGNFVLQADVLGRITEEV